jgi:uncharacterized protein YuzE
MNATYDEESDILMFVLKDELPVNTISEAGGIIISYSENNEPISIEFLNASKRHYLT